MSKQPKTEGYSMKRSQAKHKLCRRLGQCVWGQPKCPSVKRPYPAGPHGKGRQKKLSTYGELLMEKQKVRLHYGISERQLSLAYWKARQGEGQTNEKLIRNLEMRLDAVVYHSGLAPTIFAAKQFVNHRHVLVDGKIVDRTSYHCRPGQVVSINSEKSPTVSEMAKATNIAPPPYLDVDKENCKVTVAREPQIGELPVDIEIMRIIEYYAR
jgi:small subunit ribosomal protein S4